MKFKIKFADQIVGALSIFAIAALIFFTFFIASTQKWFVKKHNFFTKISSANSVNEGMALQYKGFAIGKIKKITLSDDDNLICKLYFKFHRNPLGMSRSIESYQRLFLLKSNIYHFRTRL